MYGCVQAAVANKMACVEVGGAGAIFNLSDRVVTVDELMVMPGPGHLNKTETRTWQLEKLDPGGRAAGGLRNMLDITITGHDNSGIDTYKPCAQSTDLGVLLNTSIYHMPTVHGWWPKAEVLRLKILSSSTVDHTIAIHEFIDRLAHHYVDEQISAYVRSIYLATRQQWCKNTCIWLSQRKLATPSDAKRNDL